MLGYDPDGLRKAAAMFPIRLRIRPSFDDLSEALDQTAHWFLEEPQARRYGLIAAPDAATIGFHRADDAARFLSEFPHLVLEGGLSDAAYEADLDEPTERNGRMADAPDFGSMTRAELMKLRANLDAALASVGERERRAAREAAEAAAKEYGFSLSELTGSMGSGRGKGRGRQADAGSKVSAEVRYRNPENASQTWSGRGRRPAWYNAALEAGTPIEDLKAS